MCCKASAVSRGKPTTTPSAVRISDLICARVGRCSLKMRSKASPRTPAMLARATVTNTGSKAKTATRVAGSEPLKMATPKKPLINPLVFLFISAPDQD